MLVLRRILNRNMSVYAQLATLERCGIKPNPWVAMPELLSYFSEREYERSPFRRLLSALGEASNDAARIPLSDNVWHVRVGCVEGPGDYVRFAERMATLAGEALPIHSASDEFILGGGVAWLRFRMGEREFEWPARIKERWIDPTIFSRFVGLLEDQNTNKRFTYLDLGGQDVLIGCATGEQFEALRKWTGLKFEWLG